MRFLQPSLTSLACWFLLFCTGTAGGDKTVSTGVVELDLVFPRNETYNPSPLMPIIFSYRNIGLVPLLAPQITYEVWNYTNFSGHSVSDWQEVPLLNGSSSDPYLQHSFYLFPFNTEGTWLLSAHFRWVNCFEDDTGLYPKTALTVNETDFRIIFTTKGPSKQIDLVAATSDRNCSSPAGVAINITGTVYTPVEDGGYERPPLCPVVTPRQIMADSCAVTIDAAAASSISASMTSRVCNFPTGAPDEVDCPPKEESAALRIVVGGATCLAFMLGALGYIL